MCTYIVYYNPGAEEPLIIATTRDEAPGRPTSKPFLWDQPQHFLGAHAIGRPLLQFAKDEDVSRYVDAGIIASQDLRGGGTFLGINRHGMFVAVNNRENNLQFEGRRSRGGLALDALSFTSAREAVEVLYPSLLQTQGGTGRRFPCFNVIIADEKDAFVLTNARSGDLQPDGNTPIGYQDVGDFTVGVSALPAGETSLVCGYEVNDFQRSQRTNMYLPIYRQEKPGLDGEIITLPKSGNAASWSGWLGHMVYRKEAGNPFDCSIAQPDPRREGVGDPEWITIATNLLIAKKHGDRLTYDWLSLDGPPRFGEMNFSRIDTHQHHPTSIHVPEYKPQTQKVLLVVSGSVAAITTLNLIKELHAQHMEVQVAITDSAVNYGFITRHSNSAISHTATTFAPPHHRAVPIEDIATLTGKLILTTADFVKEGAGRLAIKNADAIVVSPAASGFMAQIAYQTTDIGKALHQAKQPKIMAPAMNVKMWEHPATQRNFRQLLDHSWHAAGPVQGKMACGEFGYGRMLPVSQIAACVSEMTTQHEGGALELFQQSLVPGAKIPTQLPRTSKKILLIVQEGEELSQVEDLVGAMKAGGYQVTCALSQEAVQQLDAKSLEVKTGNVVYDRHYQTATDGMEHINLPRAHDMLVVFPASQKYVHEMATGATTSFINDVYLATDKPVVLIPTQSRNLKPKLGDIEQVKQDGGIVLKPDRSRRKLTDNVVTQITAMVQKQRQD